MRRSCLVFAAMAALLALPGCSRGGGSAGTGNGSATARCGPFADHVRELYRAEAADLDTELGRELLEANVHMVTTDCETDPARFGPCIRAATSVAGLERDCVIALDDEGTAEAKQFGK